MFGIIVFLLDEESVNFSFVKVVRPQVWIYFVSSLEIGCPLKLYLDDQEKSRVTDL
jgi:hypothetical protein